MADPRTESERIDDEAAAWAVRLGDGSWSAVDQAQLEGWLAVDSRRAGALLRARAVWVDIDRLSAIAGPGAGSHARAIPPLHPDESVEYVSEMPALVAPPNGDGASIARRRWAIGFCLLIAGLAGEGAWVSINHSNTYVSAVGQVKRVDLSDGSHMTLNTATKAAVLFDDHVREIQLSSGEGLFQVAKDADRPFVVHTGTLSVRAVGTVFSVKAEERQIDVTVTEGVVEILDDNSKGGGTVIRRVAANEHATVLEERRVQVEPMPHELAERRLAWQDGLIDFSGEPLIRAVAEINRYNHRHIVIDDSMLAARPIVGVFKADDPEGFAAAVATALRVSTRDEADAIHIRPHSD